MAPRSREPAPLPPDQRARSVPHKRPFVTAVILSAFFYLTIVATLGAIFAVFALRSHSAALAFGLCVGTNVILWLITFMKRRAAYCPLCKGTPYVDTGARKHVRARRIFPLTYGTTNVLRSIVRQRFRCQYCGTPFDLLKAVDRQLRPGARR